MKMSDLQNMLMDYMEFMVKMRSGMNKPKGAIYLGMEDFVSKNGELFTSCKYPKKYIEFRGEKRDCYRNAFQLMMSNSELTYVEGYGISKTIPLPIPHAYCVDEEGNVVDPTWDDQEDCIYFGVKFSSEYTYETIMRTQIYGLIENYKERFPLYMGKHKDFK